MQRQLGGGGAALVERSAERCRSRRRGEGGLIEAAVSGEVEGEYLAPRSEEPLVQPDPGEERVVPRPVQRQDHALRLTGRAQAIGGGRTSTLLAGEGDLLPPHSAKLHPPAKGCLERKELRRHPSA